MNGCVFPFIVILNIGQISITLSRFAQILKKSLSLKVISINPIWKLFNLKVIGNDILANAIFFFIKK